MELVGEFHNGRTLLFQCNECDRCFDYTGDTLTLLPIIYPGPEWLERHQPKEEWVN